MIWYQEEVERVEKIKEDLSYVPEVAFYGSSSFRLWNTLYEDFKDYKPVNLGFGGSTLAACVWFFDRILRPYNPKLLLIYAGDNDIGDGRTGEEIFIFFKQLETEISQAFGNIPVGFISIKPSIARFNLRDQIVYTNKIIESEIKKHQNYHYINIYDRMLDSHKHPRKIYFEQDGLHLSAAGYDLWKEILSAFVFDTICRNSN